MLITEVNLVDVSSNNNLDERDKIFKSFLLDDIKELEELSKDDKIMEDAIDKIKISENSIFIRQLEKSKLDSMQEN